MLTYNQGIWPLDTLSSPFDWFGQDVPVSDNIIYQYFVLVRSWLNLSQTSHHLSYKTKHNIWRINIWVAATIWGCIAVWTYIYASNKLDKVQASKKAKNTNYLYFLLSIYFCLRLCLTDMNLFLRTNLNHIQLRSTFRFSLTMVSPLSRYYGGWRNTHDMLLSVLFPTAAAFMVALALHTHSTSSIERNTRCSCILCSWLL